MKKVLLPSVVNFGGFAATGGSALRDFFYEYDDLFVFPAEFRLLKEKNGLLDLEKSLFISKSPDNIDLAIRDFISLSKHLGRVTTKFTRKGFNYDRYTNFTFSQSINKFVNEITDYRYPLNTHNYTFRKSTLHSQIERYAARFLPYSFFEKEAYMSYPQKEKYIERVRVLLNSIFVSACQKEKFNPKFIGLHNAVNPFTLREIYDSKKYLNNFKMILIDRDPRDIFIDFPHNRYLPKNVDALTKVDSFIHFFRALRLNLEEIKSLDYCLLISFEDLILKNKETIKRIESFLGISKRNEKKKYLKFSPEKSIKNIYKYKSFDKNYNMAFRRIEKELKEYLHLN